MKKIVIIAIALLATSTAYVYKNHISSKDVMLVSKYQSVMLENSSKIDLDIAKQQISNNLNILPEGTEKRMELARKLAIITTLRQESVTPESVAEIKNILDTLLFDSNINDFPKMMSAVSILRFFDVICYSPVKTQELFLGNKKYSNAIKSYYDKYLSKTNKDTAIQIGTMFAFVSLLEDFQNYGSLPKDSTFNSISARIPAIILRSFYSYLDEADKTKLLNIVKTNLDRYPTSGSVTYINEMSYKIAPDVRIAISNDLYKSSVYKNYDEINTNIDSLYEEAILGIDNYRGADKASQNGLNVMLSINLLDSFARRYGEKYVKTNSESLFIRLMSGLKYSEDIRSTSKTYFLGGIYGDSQWEKQKRNVMYLSKYNKEFRDFLLSIGIKEEDLNNIKPDWKEFNESIGKK